VVSRLHSDSDYYYPTVFVMNSENNEKLEKKTQKIYTHSLQMICYFALLSLLEEI
jgi:hypothetical protein